MQEKFFEYLVDNGYLSWLRGCEIVGRNPRLDTEVIDYLIKCSDAVYFVELKSAVLRVNNVYAGYPDCPTLRGRRQLKALMDHVENGGRAYVVFVAGLPAVKAFKPYDEGDPVVADYIRKAYLKGVVLKSLNIYYRPSYNDIFLENPDLPIDLDP